MRLDNKIEKIRSLVNELNEASDAYYNSGNPIMSDLEFDIRFKELQRLEEEMCFVLSNSPTQNAGYAVAKERKKVAHDANYPMLSLDKIHSVDEVKEFIGNRRCIASVKLDGLSVRCTYKNGELIQLETRGNGEIGTDIMIHKNNIANIPLKIDHDGEYIVDGECIIGYDDFKKINSQLPDDNKFSNPRNMASGSLNLLDANESSKRGLRFLVWNIIKDTELYSKSFSKNLGNSMDLGFCVVPHVILSPDDDIEATLELIKKFSNAQGLPMDGCVLSYDDIKYGKSLGRTTHHFRHSIAYKYDDEDAKTILRNIEWTMGKTGQLTPVAVFDEVELAETKVNRASLHNISICKALELGIGDTITVCKCNMIIPQVRDNLTRSNNLEIPNTCPICGGRTEIVKDKESEVLMCTNPNCEGKLLGKLSHFVSKNAINIDGLSEQNLQKLMDLGWVKSFQDVMHLKDHAEEMTQLEGFGKRSVEKLLDAIEKSRKTTLDRFIYALSIPLIGRSTSKDISRYCNNSIDEFTFIIENTSLEFAAIDGIGVSATNSLDDWWNTNRDMFYELAEEFVFATNKKENNNISVDLSGKIFVITGSLNHYKNRDELVGVIESIGGKVSGSVSAKTSYLINNDTQSSSSKNQKAQKLNIPIISEQDFINMIS